MKTTVCLLGLLLATACLRAESGVSVVSGGQQTNQLARFDGLFLTNTPLRYQDCHALLSWVDHEAHLDAKEKFTVRAKLKAFLSRKTARPLAADCDLTGLAPPEAILRAYAARLLGKYGTAADIPFLEGLSKMDQSKLPEGLRYEVTRTECEDSIKRIREGQSANQVPEDTARKPILGTDAPQIASPKIAVMPELAGQVNAQTTNNAIPWYGSGEYDSLVTAQLDNLVPLVETTQGDYRYRLYRIRFHSVKAIEGEFDAKDLTFYLERPFPTQESGIKFKELWPFQKGCVRTFKLKKVGAKFHIVSMEMEPRQAAPSNHR